MKQLMTWKWMTVILVAMIFVFGCTTKADDNIVKEKAQQATGQQALLDNQPVPDLGGYSFERDIVIKTYLARNGTIATYAYMFTMDGKIVEICPSIGYPIPYSTQLTNPLQAMTSYTNDPVVGNPEPNGLYTPSNAAATLVQCVNPDGSVSPTYIEWYVLAFPYQIASDYQIKRIGDPSFRVQVKK
jgi:hypothetical protein